MNRNRVVITGLGIVAPNGVGISSFFENCKNGVSGITFHPTLKALNFSCQIGGTPHIPETLISQYFTALELRNFDSNDILYGVIAALDALKDAKLKPSPQDAEPYWDLGVVFGSSISGVDAFRKAIYKLDEGQVRRLGSTVVAQTMTSGISAYIAGKVGAGNWVTTNSSACATGTESLLLGYEHVASGKANKMLCGSCSGSSAYLWGGFDAMKVTTFKHNETPKRGSRPMSETASGFVPASGAGAFLLESLESAKKRGATIYAEVLGGAINNGGQRQGGSMTAPNSVAIQKCITQALTFTNIQPLMVDYISAHLTATIKDPEEIKNWAIALGRKGANFPFINSLKALIGHGLASSGSMEIVATILQIKHQMVFGNVNCEDIHPEILKIISKNVIPQKTTNTNINVAIKASFGFGDVNACAIFKKI